MWDNPTHIQLVSCKDGTVEDTVVFPCSLTLLKEAAAAEPAATMWGPCVVSNDHWEAAKSNAELKLT